MALYIIALLWKHIFNHFFLKRRGEHRSKPGEKYVLKINDGNMLTFISLKFILDAFLLVASQFIDIINDNNCGVSGINFFQHLKRGMTEKVWEPLL